MPNMSLKKNPMPSQEPAVRRRNFDEVALGYTEEQAVDEAARCLNCKHHPCMSGCPVQIDIPAFIARVRERDFEGAYAVLTRQSSLPVCHAGCSISTLRLACRIRYHIKKRQQESHRHQTAYQLMSFAVRHFSHHPFRIC